jgi:beta-glucanase (GH16 family)
MFYLKIFHLKYRLVIQYILKISTKRIDRIPKLAIVLVATASTCVVSPYGDGCLVPDFSDEFNTFNSSKWTHEVTMSGGGNGEFEMYVPDTANSFVQNGALHIHPTYTANWFQQSMCTSYSSSPADWQNGCELSFNAQPTKTIYHTTTPYPGVYPGQCNDASNYGCERTASSNNILNPIVSARIFSNFSFLYGRVEVRATLPVGNWLWPAIWMLPAGSVYGTWPLSGEIDIMESRGNDASYPAGGNNRFGATLHWGSAWNTDEWSYTHQEYLDSSSTLTSQWHIYGLKWTSTGLYIYIDNDTNRILTVNMSVPLWQAYSLSGSNPWASNGINAPFNQPFYMIFNTAIGGTNGYFPTNDWGNGGATTFWANRSNWQSTWTQPDLIIDYIRVYQ